MTWSQLRIRESVGFLGILSGVQRGVGNSGIGWGFLKVFYTLYLYLLCFHEPTSDVGCRSTSDINAFFVQPPTYYLIPLASGASRAALAARAGEGGQNASVA
jgi:hypothetical protein